MIAEHDMISETSFVLGFPDETKEPVVKPINMTRAEIDMAIITCYGKFYMPKMKEFMLVKSKFRREYLLRSTKLIMQSSFLIKKFARLGIDPRQAMRDVMGKD